MKQKIAWMLIAAVLVCMTGCGAEEKTGETPEPVPSIVTGQTETTEETTAPEQTGTPLPEISISGVMEQTVLIDNDRIAVTVLSARPEPLGFAVQLQCRNKTDRLLLFSWDRVSVCGFMNGPEWSLEVNGGETAVSAAYFDLQQLAAMGVLSPDEISFRLHVFDPENWMEQPVADQRCTIYPTGKNAETVRYPHRAAAAGEQTLAENEFLRLIVEHAGAEEDLYLVRCYLKNNTDRDQMISWENVTVNGTDLDPMWSMELPAGMQAISNVAFFQTDFSEHRIDQVEKIEFTLRVTDMEGTVLNEQCLSFRP